LCSQVQEVHHLEENSKLLGRVQTAWTHVANDLHNNCISQTVSLSTARSLLEHLPDSKLGAEIAQFGDPMPLVAAVANTEDILNNSALRSAQTNTVANIWRTISNCNINLQSNNPSPLGPEGMTFNLELNDKSKEDTVCVLYGISKLLEAKIKSQLTQPVKEEEKEVIEQAEAQEEQNETIKQKPPFNSPSNNSSITSSSSSSNDSTKSLNNPKINGTDHNQWIEMPDKNDTVANKKIAKPMNSGCAYCFFDLLQGHIELGRVIIEINCKSAPKMAKNFIELCTGIHGFGYLNTKLWKISSGDHVDGGDIPEGGQCSIFDKKPFLGDASTLQDGLGMLRMRGRGTSEDGQPIVGSQFMIWIKNRKFKNYTRTLVFGIVTDGIDILTDMPETRQRKGKPFVPPVTIIKCGIME
jgi:cyclophilin family peptidyl-prolyl cis-trans isomerase